MNKSLLVSFFRWFMPGLLAVTFLFLPDFYGGKLVSPLASSWIARVFFVIYLINPFIGIAKAIEGGDNIQKDWGKYKFFTTDKDTLLTMTYLSAVFTVLSTSIVFLLAMKIFFPYLGLLSYLFWLVYTVSVGIIAVHSLRLQKEQNLI